MSKWQENSLKHTIIHSLLVLVYYMCPFVCVPYPKFISRDSHNGAAIPPAQLFVSPPRVTPQGHDYQVGTPPAGKKRRALLVRTLTLQS